MLTFPRRKPPRVGGCGHGVDNRYVENSLHVQAVVGPPLRKPPNIPVTVIGPNALNITATFRLDFTARVSRHITVSVKCHRSGKLARQGGEMSHRELSGPQEKEQAWRGTSNTARFRQITEHGGSSGPCTAPSPTADRQRGALCSCASARRAGGRTARGPRRFTSVFSTVSDATDVPGGGASVFGTIFAVLRRNEAGSGVPPVLLDAGI
ncbi:hypothetical protein CB1_000614001 [Camelus ferus]|nr:hypothetical protein CB1_000614001 [Camelus ferus]